MVFLIQQSIILILLLGAGLLSASFSWALGGTTSDNSSALYSAHNGLKKFTVSESLAGQSLLVAQLLRQVGEDEYRVAQFLKAARLGDLNQVRTFLEQGLDVNSKNTNEDTALMEAAGSGRKEVVELLLERGADVQAKNRSRQTALTLAVMNKQNDTAILLVNKGKIKKSELLWVALRHANIQLADMLLAKVQSPIDSSYLLPACESGNIEIVKLVLNKGVDPNLDNGTPLMRAIQYAPLEVIQLLLEKNAKVETEPKGYNHTPLSWACYRRRPDAARLLLEKGANPNVKATGLDSDKTGKTPLMFAVEASKTDAGYELVKLLLRNKADVNMKNGDGNTALHLACIEGSPEAVKLLLDYGADIEAKNNNGFTPLIAASFAGRVNVAMALLDRNANVNAKSEKLGWTPLAAAKKKGNTELERLLRSRGAKR